MSNYNRVLLKLSGEQLSGKADGGIDPVFIKWIAGEVKKATDSGAQIAIMVGGGNFVRGAQLADNSIQRVTADYLGMISTVMNALAVADVFNAGGLPARALSNVLVPQMIDDFTPRRALSDLRKKRVVIIGGGIGRPYLTTDTAAVSLALELDCDIIMKATKVDGVYDKDPAKHDDAVHIEKMSFQEAVEQPAIRVMDKAALGLAMEHKKPILVFDLFKEGNIAKAVSGQEIGTLIS